MAKVEHDAHFTREDEAKRLTRKFVELYDPARCRRYLEPSCGGGAFVNALIDAGVPRDHIRSLDIDPKNQADVHGDFLQSTHESLGIEDWQHVIVIGNPPFGRNGDLARAFLNKACEYGRLIAFVVPRGMQGANCCGNVKSNLGLIHEEQVGDFETTTARCNWQVWRLGDRPAYRPEEPEIDTEGLYEFVPLEDANVVVRRVGNQAGRIVGYNGSGAGNRYFIKTQNYDVYRAMLWMQPQGLADLTTHQLSLSKPALHAMVREQLLAHAIEQIVRPDWIPFGLDILKENGTLDEILSSI